jgi:hypothetical protein
MANLTTANRFEVEVLSRSNPEAALLRMSRLVLQRNPKVQELFKTTPNREVDREKLLAALQEEFPLDEGVVEVANYLSDEFEQIGDGLLLISPDTGKAIAKLTDEDIYLPAPVLRENGNLVQRKPRIRPEIEGYLIAWNFESAREKEIREGVLAKVNQTELQREEGDPRLLLLSREGRRRMATLVEDELPNLFQEATGIAKSFLDFLVVGKPPSGDSSFQKIEVELQGTVRKGLQDLTTSNLKCSLTTLSTSTLTTKWVRELGTSLLSTRKDLLKEYTTSSDLDSFIRSKVGGFWVAPYGVGIELQRRGCRVLSVQMDKSTNFALYYTGPIGFLEVRNHKLNSRELHDRWSMEATCDATVWVDWSRVEYVSFEGDFTSGISVEVV